ncbi:unnamed protein product [Polarella glacialis]|uniref:GST N-terminal domain-containing protein n=1 Tax=Polarella glacialis TaxID=89957 RepID=A0A813KN71_POLGL|nr:unnamed protein product [Polarella glacialis]
MPELHILRTLKPPVPASPGVAFHSLVHNNNNNHNNTQKQQHPPGCLPLLPISLSLAAVVQILQHCRARLNCRRSGRTERGRFGNHRNTFAAFAGSQHSFAQPPLVRHCGKASGNNNNNINNTTNNNNADSEPMADLAGDEQDRGAKRQRLEVGKPLVLLDVLLPGPLLKMLNDLCDVALLEDTAAWETRSAEVLAVFSYQHIPITASLLEKLSQLRVVSNFGAGYDHIDAAACQARGIPLGNTPGVVAAATADLAIALALAATRNLVSGHARYCAKPEFDPNWWGEAFTGCTLGIVGLGNIGKQVAARALAFQTRTLYWGRRRAAPQLEAELQLSELLEQSDVVVLCVAVTPETRNLIGAVELRSMKRTALLVNVARGKIVDTDALVHALQIGEIAKAALDVTEPEPLPLGHPLLQLENVILSPHLGTAESGTRCKMMAMALANLRAGLDGMSLPHPVACCSPEAASGTVSEAAAGTTTATTTTTTGTVSEAAAGTVAHRRLRLVVGNKAYSSWSLRAWLACRKACGRDGFDEVVVPLAGAGSDAQRDVLLQYSPTGKVPALTDSSAEGLTVWDSLAICEYVAELHPAAGLWPQDPRARALARAATSEMHSGFQALRNELPMNCRRLPVQAPVGEHASLRKPGVARDISRIFELWETCLTCPWRDQGPFLLGGFGIVDAMFAPVVLRFEVYKPELTDSAARYCTAIRNLPEVLEWVAAAKLEDWHIDHYEDL